MTVASHPYRAVALDIAARIDSGSLEPNDKLPSVRDLAKQEGVSPVTAQKALAYLAEMGYAISSPVGYRVAPEGDRRKPASEDISEQLTALQARVEALEGRLSDLEDRQAGE